MCMNYNKKLKIFLKFRIDNENKFELLELRLVSIKYLSLRYIGQIA